MEHLGNQCYLGFICESLDNIPFEKSQRSHPPPGWRWPSLQEQCDPLHHRMLRTILGLCGGQGLEVLKALATDHCRSEVIRKRWYWKKDHVDNKKYSFPYTNLGWLVEFLFDMESNVYPTWCNLSVAFMHFQSVCYRMMQPLELLVEAMRDLTCMTCSFLWNDGKQVLPSIEFQYFLAFLRNFVATCSHILHV